jgi:hypothetical protein
MLHISPDNDKFFDAQETPSFSPRPYDDTQEEAFFDCMEEEDDQHYLPIQQPWLNKKRKREEGPTGNNWGKKSHFFSNRKVHLSTHQHYKFAGEVTLRSTSNASLRGSNITSSLK